MDIRGAGNLLGGEQSGFIAEIGLEMYQKILNEAIRELKHDEFKDLFTEQKDEPVTETQLETDLELLIPDRYVASVNERLVLYTKINDIENEEGLQSFSEELVDRFGPIPRQTKELLDTVRMKWIARHLCIEKLTLKRGRFKAVFSPRAGEKFFQSDVFGRVIAYIQEHPQRSKINQKEEGLEWMVNDMGRINNVLTLFKQIKEGEK